MELLKSLGVNSTVWIQLVIFVVTFAAGYLLVFKPYLAAYLKRLELTEGNEERAVHLNKETDELVLKYDVLAKELNAETRTYYERAQKEAQEAHSKTLEAATKEAEQLIQTTRKKIVEEVNVARGDLKKSIPELSQAIEMKFLGGDA